MIRPKEKPRRSIPKARQALAKAKRVSVFEVASRKAPRPKPKRMPTPPGTLEETGNEIARIRSAVTAKLQAKLTEHKANKQSLWKGPLEDGITFSLLNDFLECRERFRLHVVEGLVEDEGFSAPLEYGQLWHTAEEAHSGRKNWLTAMFSYFQHLRSQYPSSKEPEKWYQIAKLQFPQYIDFWKNDPVERNRQPLVEETAFRVPFELPSGNKVTLRGKFDCVLTFPNKQGKRSLYIQENKTKGRIDEDGIEATLRYNLQTGIYATALNSVQNAVGFVEKEAWGSPFYKELGKYPFGGVLFNVIRRPLGDHHAIRQKKAETESQFIKRVGAGVAADPAHYFMRYQIDLTQAQLYSFNQRILTPLLEQVCLWWESIKDDPWNPWGSPHHFQAPWGTYNSLAGGFRGSHYKYLTSGSPSGLKRIQNLYPELTELGQAAIQSAPF